MNIEQGILNVEVKARLVEVRSSEIQGLGVFALSDIEKDEVFEQCHMVPIHHAVDLPESIATIVYEWDDAHDALCVLGVGNFFNHSKEANAKIHEVDRDNNLQSYSAIRKISKGEEITIFYNDAFERFIQS